MIIDDKFYGPNLRVLLEVDFDTIQGRKLEFYGKLEYSDNLFQVGSNDDSQIVWFKEENVSELSYLTKTIVLKWTDSIGFCLAEMKPVFKPF